MGVEDTPHDGVPTADKEPPYSAIFCIHLTVPGFDDVEGPMFRLLLTGWLDEHVDVWPEEKGRVLFAHAPIAAPSWSDAMTKAHILAQAALELCPSDSVIAHIETIDWSVDDPAEASVFWAPENPPEPSNITST